MEREVESLTERRAKTRDGRLESSELGFRGPGWEEQRLPATLSRCIRWSFGHSIIRIATPDVSYIRSIS